MKYFHRYYGKEFQRACGLYVPMRFNTSSHVRTHVQMERTTLFIASYNPPLTLHTLLLIQLEKMHIGTCILNML